MMMNKDITQKPNKPAWLISLIVIATFIIVDIFTTRGSRAIINAIAGDWPGLDRVFAYGVFHWGLPYVLVPIIVTALLFGKSSVFDKLGLNRSALKGLGFAFAVCLPLPLAYGFTTPLARTVELLPNLLHYAIFSSTAEEVLYRCFLFGLLFRTARWGFLPAALLGGIIFGIGHLYQGNNILESSGVFLITFVGALWWSWLYVEWDYNAWVPIGFHVFMNGWFQVFVVSETALLPIAGEIARAFVVLLSIGLTLALAKRHGGGRTIIGPLWWKA